jgi:hypothetical protein
MIGAGAVTILAPLLSTPRTAAIWQALPIRSTARAGDEESTSTSLSRACGRAAPRTWSPREIGLASRCNIWALAIDDVTALEGVLAGERIEVAASA